MSEKERLQYEKLVLTPVEKLIPKLAVPTIISMMITMIYNLVDAYFVGKLGTSASAAIGIVLGVQSIIQAFGFMLGHGAGSQISVHLGQGDRDAADRLLSTAFFTAAGFSILLTHGTDIKSLENAAKQTMLLYGESIDYLICGHKHREQEYVSGYTDQGNAVVIRVPSLCGMDEFAQRLGYGGKPGALAMVLEAGYGRRCIYPISL